MHPPERSSPLPLPAGMRATRAVVALLRLLPAQPDGGWTQALVETALQQQGIAVNRVTVYRALDRLTQAGLLRRSIDALRTTRYWVAEAGGTTPSAHTHMECKACHQPMALDERAATLQAALLALRQAVVQATGVCNPTLDVTVHAQCALCAGDGASTSSTH